MYTIIDEKFINDVRRSFKSREQKECEIESEEYITQLMDFRNECGVNNFLTKENIKCPT